MLAIAAFAVTLVVAAAHVAFMVLETFLWTRPVGLRIFQLSAEEAETTKVLAKNQGVYNGAFAAALAYAVFAGHSTTVMVLLVFAIVVGVYGAITVKPTILFLQALPAAVALALTLLA